jgi:hypothetical protein
MSMSEPFVPERDQRRNETSVRDTEGEDQPDVFLPERGANPAGPDEAEEHVHLPEKTLFRPPNPDELHHG